MVLFGLSKKEEEQYQKDWKEANLKAQKELPEGVCFKCVECRKVYSISQIVFNSSASGSFYPQCKACHMLLRGF